MISSVLVKSIKRLPVVAGVLAALPLPLKQGVRRYTKAQGDALITGFAITLAFLAILHFDLGAWIFAQFEHRQDAKRDAAILGGLIMSGAFGIFALRRWIELSREIKVRIAAEARATALASEDVLTGLPNRRALTTELTRAVARSTRNGESVSLLFMDLDRFKPVNDVYGHMAGDSLLQEIARRLLGTVRAGEFAARLGGDEFAVVISHDRDDQQAPLLAATRLTEVITKAVNIGPAEVHVGVTTGIATFPADADTIETLLRHADIALYSAKQGERGRCRMFNAHMDAEVRERALIESDLRAAIASHNVVPHFQPLIDLRTGFVMGFEALARWPHAGSGFIPPTKFIPIAEECGLIGDLSTSLLQQACRLARNWAHEPILSVNISPTQLADRLLADKILALLAAADFPAQRLEVEITESALVSDLERARNILLTLKTAGVSICIDDFGAGYSSLMHLTSMPFNRVKIDRTFVQAGTEFGDADKVLSAIVALCRSLGLQTTGEGVETEQHCKRIIDAGCSIGQGWYFGAALSATDARRLSENPDLKLKPWQPVQSNDDSSGVVPIRQFLRSPREKASRAQ